MQRLSTRSGHAWAREWCRVQQAGCRTAFACFAVETMLLRNKSIRTSFVDFELGSGHAE